MDDNVSLITRQILIAGVIALAAAIVAGFLAARAHAGRLRRLEAAAEKVAHGDFSTPIPVDSEDEVGQLAMTLEEMRGGLPGSTTRARSSSRTHRTSCERRSSRSADSSSCIDEDDPDPAARAEFVATMREQIERLTKLTTDLLDLSKLDADALQVRAEEIDLTSSRSRSPRSSGRRPKATHRAFRWPDRAL